MFCLERLHKIYNIRSRRLYIITDFEFTAKKGNVQDLDEIGLETELAMRDRDTSLTVNDAMSY